MQDILAYIKKRTAAKAAAVTAQGTRITVDQLTATSRGAAGSAATAAAAPPAAAPTAPPGAGPKLLPGGVNLFFSEADLDAGGSLAAAPNRRVCTCVPARLVCMLACGMAQPGHGMQLPPGGVHCGAGKPTSNLLVNRCRTSQTSRLFRVPSGNWCYFSLQCLQSIQGLLAALPVTPPALPYHPLLLPSLCSAGVKPWQASRADGQCDLVPALQGLPVHLRGAREGGWPCLPQPCSVPARCCVAGPAGHTQANPLPVEPYPSALMPALQAAAKHYKDAVFLKFYGGKREREGKGGGHAGEPAKHSRVGEAARAGVFTLRKSRSTGPCPQAIQMRELRSCSRSA